MWQAVASACQVLFMISRAPRVPWEAMYLPATEALSYGLSFYGEGYVRLASGKVLPWCRMAAWLCTCPIMLGMVSNMALIKYKSQPLNPMMVAASIIRTVFGISATMAHEEHVIWVHAFFSFVCFLFEMACAWAIFALTIQDFRDIGSPLALKTVGRLHLLRMVFFFTWNCFPILWMVSSTYGCLIHENVSAILYLFADVSCKNSYGILLWATTWGILNGKWDREYARDRDVNGLLIETDDKQKKPIEPPKENFDVKLFGTTIASVRRSTRRPRADMEFVDRPRRRDRSVDSFDDYDHPRGATREEKRRNRDMDRDYDRERMDEYNDRTRRQAEYDRDYRHSDRDRGLSRPETRMGEMPTTNTSLPVTDDTVAAVLEAMRRNAEATVELERREKKSDSMC